MERTWKEDGKNLERRWYEGDNKNGSCENHGIAIFEKAVTIGFAEVSFRRFCSLLWLAVFFALQPDDFETGFEVEVFRIDIFGYLVVASFVGDVGAVSSVEYLE